MFMCDQAVEIATVDPVKRIRALVLDSVASPHTRRVYRKALDEFFCWQETAGWPGLNKAAVQAFRTELERRGFAPSTTNVFLSAIRKLATEAADNDLLDPALAAGIARTSGVRQSGIRSGKWLTAEEASDLIDVPGTGTLKGARDRAILALLVGCGLRRAELTALEVSSFDLREGRWVLPDLQGKGKRIRTVPIPGWVKLRVDEWLRSSNITQGAIFRRLRKGGRITALRLTEDAIWNTVREYGAAIGHPTLAPHDLRRTCAKLCRGAGGDLEQIQMLLGHASIQTTERYLGSRQNLVRAVNDALPLKVTIIQGT
jgi:integrase/recombinase XerD